MTMRGQRPMHSWIDEMGLDHTVYESEFDRMKRVEAELYQQLLDDIEGEAYVRMSLGLPPKTPIPEKLIPRGPFRRSDG